MQDYVREMSESGYSPGRIDKFHKIALAYLARRFFPNKDVSILEVGVGSGHCLLPLKRVGYKNLIGIDKDPFNFTILKSEGISCIQADISKRFFPLKDSTADVIILFHLIEHFIDIDICLEQISRVLKDGGLLLLSTPDWRRQYKIFFSDHTHIHPYDKVSIRRLLGCFQFQILWIRNFGVVRGLGRLWPLWKIVKPLMFTGIHLIAVALNSKR